MSQSTTLRQAQGRLWVVPSAFIFFAVILSLPRWAKDLLFFPDREKLSVMLKITPAST